MQYLSKEQKSMIFLSGIFTGMAATIRHDFGTYVAIALSITILMRALFLKNREERKNSHLGRLRTVVLYYAGALLVAMPFYEYFVYSAGFHEMWEQMIVFPAMLMPAVRHYPYFSSLKPSIDNISLTSIFKIQILRHVVRDSLFLVFPLIVYSVGLIRIIRSFMKTGGFYINKNYEVTLLIIFGVLLMLQAFNRPDRIHFLPTSLITFIIFGYILSSISDDSRGLRTHIATALIMVTFVFIYFYSPLKTTMEYAKNYRPWIRYSELVKAAGVFVPKDQEQAVNFIANHSETREPIYVSNSRHDLIFINDIGFYYLADRPCASFYHLVDPAMATPSPVQQRIINDLASKNVTWIVLVEMPISKEDNLSSVPSGVRVLDDWIKVNYKKEALFGRYEIYKKIRSAKDTS
jgi:hypothetical protein